jgi:pimeloyl-ACP methyl ester carboxylesterase
MGVIVLVAPVCAQEPSPTSEPQRWKGAVALPGGMKLDFTIALAEGGGGTISIPMQGAKDIPLASAKIEGKSLAFVLAPPGAPGEAHAKFDFTISEDGDSAAGTLSQMGQTLPVKMERITGAEAVDAEPKRPQIPKPPFPYEERLVEFKNEAGGITIAGTLTVPAGAGPHPAVVLMTGSGPQDRDETIFGHKPFMVYADALTRAGIAVLRTDDRGVGGTTGSLIESTSQDLASDALAGIAFLKSQPGIDAKRLGVMGHSEGASLAPLVAASAEDVRFVVMLAGYAMPGADLMGIQSAAILRGEGVKDEALLADVVAAHRAAMDAVRSGAPEAEGIAKTAALIKAQTRAMGVETSDEDASAQAAQQYASLQSPWFRSFLSFGAAESLRQVRVPVLAIVGERDLQVPPRDTIPGIESALKDAGNADVTFKEMPGLNHLLQTCETGTMAEYATIEETISPAVIELVVAWVREKTGLK